MRVIIAGSRTITNYDEVDQACLNAWASGWIIGEIISGCAVGVDSLGEEWAKRHELPIKRFPAQWDKHGKSAGPIRNEEMAKNADALILVWDGKSRGSANMLRLAHLYKLKVYERIVV